MLLKEVATQLKSLERKVKAYWQYYHYPYVLLAVKAGSCYLYYPDLMLLDLGNIFKPSKFDNKSFLIPIQSLHRLLTKVIKSEECKILSNSDCIVISPYTGLEFSFPLLPDVIKEKGFDKFEEEYSMLNTDISSNFFLVHRELKDKAKKANKLSSYMITNKFGVNLETNDYLILACDGKSAYIDSSLSIYNLPNKLDLGYSWADLEDIFELSCSDAKFFSDGSSNSSLELKRDGFPAYYDKLYSIIKRVQDSKINIEYTGKEFNEFKKYVKSLPNSKSSNNKVSLLVENRALVLKDSVIHSTYKLLADSKEINSVSFDVRQLKVFSLLSNVKKDDSVVITLFNLESRVILAAYYNHTLVFTVSS